MIPKIITKEHIEKAILEINRKGVRDGSYFSTCDLLINGKHYPPRLVISIANRYANGIELEPTEFTEEKDNSVYELLKSEGFEIIQKTDPIKLLIENYKKHISKTQLQDEIYKWKLVKEFKGRPDITALDFYKEIKDIKFNNLVYALGIAVVNQLSKEKPEELRSIFKYLFDESKDLFTRMTYFNIETLKLYRTLGETLQHHQDERTIATYLTYHDPNEYTFYKSSFYKKYCKLIGVNEVEKNKKYIHYLDLINQLIENYIKPDVELINQVKGLIPDYYNGINHKLLAQDILYQMLDKENTHSYWIFQGNPKVFDFETALRNEILTDWTVSAHKDKIKIGDKVILWITGNKSGCYALAEVTSEPHQKTASPDDHLWIEEDKSTLKVDIKITHNLVDKPIFNEMINGIEELKELKVGNQGTNFSATEDEFNSLLELINSRESSFKKIISQLNKNEFNNYIEFLKEIIRKFNLTKGDHRLVFSIRDNCLNFTIGQRYCWNIYIFDERGKYGVISEGEINSNSTLYEGGAQQPFYTYFNDISLVDKNSDSIFLSIENELKRTKKSGFRKHNNIEFENYVFSIEQTSNYNQMNFPLNTILYGPPGTGKTYNTILRSAEIVENRKIDSYDEALKIFKDNLHNRIEFITFHQNYSYEDFIQGLRPEIDNKSSLTFDKKDGVFKKIAEKALENIKLSEKAPEELSKEALFDNALENFKEVVEENDANYPINETAFIMEVEEEAFRYTGEKWTNHSNGLRMKFSDLKEFYKNGVTSRKDVKHLSNISGLAAQHATYYFLVYEKIIKLLPKKIDAPLKVERKNYVIVIDEINRANISRVFGELITLIEPDKRSHGEIPLEAKLPSGDTFIVPSNLYIIGTMNTADKSIALLDIALRRRFEFESMYPLYEIQGSEIYDKDILLKINEQIIKSKGHDFQIGHAYFMGENKDLIQRMNKKVIPLLLEYFMNDEKEVKGILLNAGLQVEENSWPIKIIDRRV